MDFMANVILNFGIIVLWLGMNNVELKLESG